MAQRNRNVQIKFRVTDQELEQIDEKMRLIGTRNREGYLRKMALNGRILVLDMPQIKQVASLTGRLGNNVNQLVRRAHETGRVYDVDLDEILKKQSELTDAVREILMLFSKLEAWAIIDRGGSDMLPFLFAMLSMPSLSSRCGQR